MGEPTDNTPANEPTGNEPQSNEPKGSNGAVAFYKTQAETMREQIASMDKANKELQKQIESIKEDSLKNSKSYKELYEKKAQEIEDIRKQNEARDKAYINTLKRRAIEEEALAQGFDKDVLKFIHDDTDFVKHETTSMGNINIYGAKEFVEKFKAENPKLLFSNTPPNINTSKGEPPAGTGSGYTGKIGEYSGDGSDLSAGQLLQLEKANYPLYTRIMKAKIDGKK